MMDKDKSHHGSGSLPPPSASDNLPEEFFDGAEDWITNLLAAEPGSSSSHSFPLELDGPDVQKAEATAMLAEQEQEQALTYPNRAERVLENNQYIAELERKVQAFQRDLDDLRSENSKLKQRLQTREEHIQLQDALNNSLKEEIQRLKVATGQTTSQLTLLQPRDMNGLTSENRELKQRLQTMEEHIQLQDALNDSLEEEIQRLKVATGQTTSQLTLLQQRDMNDLTYDNRELKQHLQTMEEHIQLQDGQSGAFNLPQPRLGTSSSSGQGHFCHDIPPNNMGHKRANDANLAVIDPKRAKRPVEQSVSQQKVNKVTKIISQTTTEVHHLDDGYRWKKYSAKFIQGNPYPRSYYKCISPLCQVRRQVERDPTEPKLVITYEGEHTHEIPVQKM